ncbi:MULTISPECIES: dihydropteroate synthase [Olivibacter]|jgi:dihydropteroate synthase|uniref:Dihydropteroate synthase n=3 Tax=Sphingobacteriaceae TaxID=84566 RepID=F4C7T0_SPHS2|nr:MULTISPECIES: dihydropteroate synthase [Olivibacter]MCL4639107.1 dihydropteroate synthase [Olivibacter sp. UJ_SKK_5.1]MDM8173949.1 dihydropteroate synthase [Olivibacter sp. 47]MDX3915133.1 dihydropteroate synthase [Pseudosphingobacterium sp.]QEL03735.1 dihydropteroate synthase [Olivibacter sp. LS-1]
MKFCNVGGKLLDFHIPKIMGILNMTPDSFFDGGKHNNLNNALDRVGTMLEEGADIIDVGAYSSRPGARVVDFQEELDRLLPIVDAIRKTYPNAVLSIDTFRADVAIEAVKYGAHIINDIGGGNLDEKMFTTIARLGVPYVLMHSKGTPETMQNETAYQDLINDITSDLTKKIEALRSAGVKDIIVDPGFGFAKTLEQNYLLLSRIEELRVLGLPILGAVSRKSMIYKLLNSSPQEALNGTSVLNTILLFKGVEMIRVHDVKEAVEVRKLVMKTRAGEAKRSSYYE